MTRALLIAVGIVCATFVGCRPSRRAWRVESPAPSLAIATAFGVVAPTRRLHLAPDPASPTLRLPPIGGGRAWALRIVSAQNGWTEVETIGSDTGSHCGEVPSSLQGVRLRFYLPGEESLGLVTRREVQQAFRDGTRAELVRGVPVTRASGGLYRVDFAGAYLLLRLTRADVGTRYLPSPARTRPPALYRLRDQTLSNAIPILGQTGRVGGRGNTIGHAYPVEGSGRNRLVDLRTSCGRLRVRVPADAIEPTVEVDPAEPVRNRDRLWVAPRTEVRWSNGEPAGVTTEAFNLGPEIGEGGSVAHLRCFAHPILPIAGVTPRLEDSLTLCFAADRVFDSPMGPAGLLADPTP